MHKYHSAHAGVETHSVCMLAPRLGVKDPERGRRALLCSHFLCSKRRAAGPALSPWPKRSTRDDWTLCFCPQLTLWISDKLLTSQDVSFDDARNLHNNWLKHQAFMAELASHQGALDSVDAVSNSRVLLCSPEWGSPRHRHRPEACWAA